MKSSFILTLGMLLCFITIDAHAANSSNNSNNELRIRCETKRDVNACMEIGLSDMKVKDKVHKKSAQRELKKACAIQMNRACSKQETKTMALAYIANKNRIPANTTSRSTIRAPKLTGQGKKYSSGTSSPVPAYEPPPMNEPPQPPMPAEPPYLPPPPMPPPPPAMMNPGLCMPGDVSCMQGQPMGQ